MAGTSRKEGLELPELVEVHTRVEIHAPPQPQDNLELQEGVEQEVDVKLQKDVEFQEQECREDLKPQEHLGSEEGPGPQDGHRPQDGLESQESHGPQDGRGNQEGRGIQDGPEPKEVPGRQGGLGSPDNLEHKEDLERIESVEEEEHLKRQVYRDLPGDLARQENYGLGLKDGFGRLKGILRQKGLWRQKRLDGPDGLVHEEDLRNQPGPSRQLSQGYHENLEDQQDLERQNGRGLKDGFGRVTSFLVQKVLWRQKSPEPQEKLATEEVLEPQPGPSRQKSIDSIEGPKLQEELATEEDLEPQPGPSRQKSMDPLGGSKLQEELATEEDLEPQPGPSHQKSVDPEEGSELPEDLTTEQDIDIKPQPRPFRQIKNKHAKVWQPRVIDPAEIELQKYLFTKLPFDVDDPTTVWPPKWSGNVVILKDAVVQYKISNDDDDDGEEGQEEVHKNTEEALTGINITIKKGTCHVITGHTGTGKSTILKILSGQCKLKSGTVSVLGSKPSKYVNRVYSKLFGIMPQTTSLYKEYTAIEFLRYFGNLHGMSPEEVELRIKKLSLIFRLKKLNRPIGKYSGGQRRRLSCMTALIHSPAVVVLDEPLLGLDILVRTRIWNYLKRQIKATGMTVIMLTAYGHEGVHADMMSVLRDGVVQLEGTYGYLRLTLGQWTLSDGILKYFEEKKKKQMAAIQSGETNEGIELTELRSEQPEIHETNEGIELTDLRRKPSEIGEINEGFELSEQPESDMPTVDASEPVEDSLDTIVVQKVEAEAFEPAEDNLEAIAVKQEEAAAAESVEDNLDAIVVQQGEIETAEPVEDDLDTIVIQQNEAETSQKNMKLEKNKVTTDISAEEAYKLKEPYHGILGSFGRLKSLVNRNFIRLYRSILFLIFALSVPLLEVASMYVCFGQEPHAITVGVYNGELSRMNKTECDYKPNGECLMDMLSCQLLEILSKEKLILKHYGSEEEVLLAAKKGRVNGYFIVQPEFTSKLRDWMMFGGQLDDDEKEKLKIKVGKDSMELAYSTYVNRRTKGAVQKFLMEHMADCHLDYRKYIPPFLVLSFSLYLSLKNQDKDYEEDAFTYGDFATSGTLLVIIFFFPKITSSIMLIGDKADGTYQRGIAAGVRVVEYYAAQWITQTLLLLFQSLTALSFIWVVFGENFEGHIATAMIICMMVGKCGIMTGFVMSIICTNLMASLYITIGLLIPTMAVAGVVWPMAGLKGFFDWVGYLAPIGVSVDALRGIITQGLGLSSPVFWTAMMALSFWIFFLKFIFILLLKYFVIN